MEKSIIRQVKIAVALAILLALSTFYCKKSYSQQLDNIGFAAFNITSEKFNCSAFTQVNTPLKTIHLSFLYNTFGNDFSCLQTVMQDSRLKTLQVHLINEPGHRNRRLGNYEFLFNIKTPTDYNRLVGNRDAKLKQDYITYLTPLKQFLEQNLQAHTELLISPGLESNLTDASGKILIEWTREIFPNTRIVWTPLKKTSNTLRISTADLLEAHGLFPFLSEPCIFNLDGADISYPNRPALGETKYTEGESKNWIQSGAPVFQLYEEMANTCEFVFVWAAESNGLDYRKTFVDPRLRQNRISLSSYRRIYKDIYDLSNKGLVYPKTYSYTESDNYITQFCSEVRTNFQDRYKAGRLLKQSEFRSRGAVLILPNEFNDVTVAKLYKGRVVVDTYNKVGRYKDGRNMFRSKRSPTTYPFGTYLVLNKKSSKICYKIPNPRVRLD
ncbi:MAG: hypothetical protein ACK5GV_08815 [Bacteroidota bacterium]|jgi:hypothetical protein